MTELRFAILGTGFWARYQLAGWRELPGARCMALWNRTRTKAQALADSFSIASVYDTPEELLSREKLDFVDIITDVGTHRQFVELAVAHRVPAVCQKPMGTNLAEAEAMVEVCRKAGVPLLINENWRWQTPLRELHRVIASGIIGRVFRARIDYCNSFPVFDNQPFLKTVDQFIIADMGSHILDVARFLFGEATALNCWTNRVHPDIQGEDVATVLLRMRSGATVTCNLSYASRVEHDRFPETYGFVEGTAGSAELGPDFWIRVTTSEGTTSRRCPPPFYAWADPRYALVHSSIVECQRDLLRHLSGQGLAETTGEDNLKTVRLVSAAYDSAASGETVRLPV
ncbi:MAG: Gfo/Idh/MocA family oxidoreductase [Verrucomicrobia subdivision 3 bacterium]|nr:Gfo/Idh/MocA family oxidoreductase [Limisphaerales bacterium]